jgi:hypothetical protein
MQNLDQTQQMRRKNLLKIAGYMYREEDWEMLVIVTRQLAQTYRQLSEEEFFLFYTSHKALLRKYYIKCMIMINIAKHETLSMDDLKCWKLVHERRITDFNRLYDQTIALIDNLIIPSETRVTYQIYFYIIKAKFHLYKVKMIDDVEERKAMAEPSLIAYRTAYDLTLNNEEISPISSITFVVAYEYTIFLSNIMQSKTDAFDIARQTYDRAIPFRESISDNLTINVLNTIDFLRDELFNEWVNEMCSSI